MPFFGHLVKEASSGPCCALVLCRVEAVMVLQQLMGHESVKEARGRTGDAGPGLPRLVQLGVSEGGRRCRNHEFLLHHFHP